MAKTDASDLDNPLFHPGKRQAKDGRWFPVNPKPRCPQGQGPPRKSRSVKARLLTRDKLDGRTLAVRHFDAVARGIAEDLGGEGMLSTVQKCLVEAFAGIAVHVHNLNARLLAGEKVDILVHSVAVSTMVRTATRVGIHRLPRDVTTLHDAMNAEIEAADFDVESR
jgi:hypothetical protein